MLMKKGGWLKGFFMIWQNMKVYERVVLLRWVLPITIFVVVVGYQLFLFRWVHDEVGFVQHSALEIAVYGVIGPIVLFLALNWVAQGLKQKEEAERLFHEREHFLANITDNAAEAILSLDTNFVVRFWNQGARRIFGYESTQMLGQNIEKLFLPQQRSSEIEELKNTLNERGIVLDYETVFLQRTEEPVSVEMTITSVFDHQDQLEGYSMMVHDISLRKRREKMLSEERKRIAGEIHDSFSQDLYSANLKLEVCQKLINSNDLASANTEIELVRSVIKKGLRDVRRAIFALQPIDLEEMGFEAAIKHLLRQYQQLYQFELNIDLQPLDPLLTKRMKHLVFRTLQECLNNVAKHARAQQIWVSMHVKEPGKLLMSVRDDGQGFLPERVDTKAHLGLTHMKEQVERQGGETQVETELGVGTSVHLTLPLNTARGRQHGTYQSIGC